MNWRNICIVFLLLLTACLIGYQNNRSAFNAKEAFTVTKEMRTAGEITFKDMIDYLSSIGLSSNEDKTIYLKQYAVFAKVQHNATTGYGNETIKPIVDIELKKSSLTANEENITLQLFLHKNSDDHNIKIRIFKTGVDPPTDVVDTAENFIPVDGGNTIPNDLSVYKVGTNERIEFYVRTGGEGVYEVVVHSNEQSKSFVAGQEFFASNINELYTCKGNTCISTTEIARDYLKDCTLNKVIFHNNKLTYSAHYLGLGDKRIYTSSNLFYTDKTGNYKIDYVPHGECENGMQSIKAVCMESTKYALQMGRERKEVGDELCRDIELYNNSVDLGKIPCVTPGNLCTPCEFDEYIHPLITNAVIAESSLNRNDVNKAKVSPDCKSCVNDFLDSNSAYSSNVFNNLQDKCAVNYEEWMTSFLRGGKDGTYLSIDDIKKKKDIDCAPGSNSFGHNAVIGNDLTDETAKRNRRSKLSDTNTVLVTTNEDAVLPAADAAPAAAADAVSPANSPTTPAVSPANSPTTPAVPPVSPTPPIATTTSNFGTSIVNTFNQLIGGASSTSTWLPSWATTNDDKDKTIQVIDDNYNVYVNSGGRRYSSGGVWDDLNSYDCPNLNSTRRFDTMSTKCQNMWLNIYGKEIEDCYKYVQKGHSWSSIPRRCKNILSSYFSLSRDGYDNSRLTQLALKDYESTTMSGTDAYLCNSFCKDRPCTNQCKRWSCSNCTGDDVINQSEIVDAVNAAKEEWKVKGKRNAYSLQRLNELNDYGRAGRASQHHFSDNLKSLDDNDSAWNAYKGAVPFSEIGGFN